MQSDKTELLTASRRLRASHLLVLAALVVALGLLWRIVRYGLCFPIWGDEAMLITSLLQRNFASMIHPLEYGITAPIGFMWAELGVARMLGYSEWALRLLPFVSGIAAVFLFWWLANRILDRRAALLAVAIFSCAYFPVRHTAEVKPYSTDLLISLVLTCLGWGVYRQPERLGLWFLLTAFGVFAVWASYPAIFVAAGVGLLLLWAVWHSPSWEKFITCMVYGLCTAGSFLAMYLLVGRTHYAAAPHTVACWEQAFPPLFEPLRLVIWLLDVHTSLMLAYPIGGKYGGSAATSILVALACTVLWRRNRALLVLLLAPLMFTFVAAALKKYPYGTSARISLYMAPAFCLLAGLGLRVLLKKILLPRGWLGAGIIISVLVIALVPIGGMAKDIIWSYKNPWDYETRRILIWLKSQTRNADRWVVLNALKATPYAPDISGYGGSGARIYYYVTRFAPGNVSWGPPPQEVSGSPGSRVWLIVYHDNRVPLPVDKVNAYLQILTEKMGKPKSYRFPLGRTTETIEIFSYEVPNRSW